MTDVLKPPFHYTGNKWKVLPQIFERIPSDCNRHIDLFGGSGVVACNLAQRGYANVCYNEYCTPVYEMFDQIIHNANFAKFAETTNLKYKSTKEDYLRLRRDYNTMDLSHVGKAVGLYNLICRSFSNGVRFNSKGEFNLPYGERNYFDKDRLAVVSGLPISTFNLSFDQFNFVENDWVFIDCPYHSTSSHYTDNWIEEMDLAVLDLLDHLDEIGAKFCYTHIIRNRGVENIHLQQFLTNRDYRVESTASDFRNTSFRKSSEPTAEVIVSNY